MPAKKAATNSGFTADERAAMRERAREAKSTASAQDEAKAVLEKIAAMSTSDRAMAKRVHAIVIASAPSLAPKLWYGMPAYAKEGKIVCFFQAAEKFKTRYSTFGFSDQAALDDGEMWPVAYALNKLTPADEKRLGALVKKAVG